MSPDQSQTQLAVLPESTMVPTTLQSCMEFANIMCKGGLIPAHLRNAADALRVVIQSSKWQLDPFAVADKTSVINGKLMYEGQLVMAVINSRGKMKERLSYDYKGEGDNRVLTVTGTVQGEDKPREIVLPFTLAKKINKNGQMGINPDQQAAYIGARLWARKHMPELMMGIYTPDEIDPDEPLNVTPGIGAKRDEAPAKADHAGGEKVDLKKKATGTKAAAIEVSTTEVKEKKPITALRHDEKITVVAVVAACHGEMVTIGGVATPSTVAELTGGYVGKVYHIGGATVGQDTVTPNEPWGANKPLEFALVGRARKDPKLPCNVFVEAVKIHEPVAQTAPAAQETGNGID